VLGGFFSLNLVVRDLRANALHQLYHEMEVMERRQRVSRELIRFEEMVEIRQ